MGDAVRPVLKVRFYRTASGERPVRDWLVSLPKGLRHRIGQDIARVQWQWPMGKPLVDGFGSGLYEVRTSYDGEKYRVLFYIEGTSVVVVEARMVIVHGFHKKTRTTPDEVVALARKRMREGT
jgi:phage-related protein